LKEARTAIVSTSDLVSRRVEVEEIARLWNIDLVY